MYGSLGPSGPAGAYAPGGVSGQYGIPILGVPVAWGLIAGTTAVGLTAVGVGAAVSSNMADAEAARHTGGKIRNTQTGQWESADVVHSRLCGSLPDDHYMKQPDKNGIVFCDRAPSGEAAYWADTPDGVLEHFYETLGGYDYRKSQSGDCDEVGADGQPLDPRCTPNPQSPIKPWMLFAVAGVIAVGILFTPKKKA